MEHNATRDQTQSNYARTWTPAAWHPGIFQMHRPQRHQARGAGGHAPAARGRGPRADEGRTRTPHRTPDVTWGDQARSRSECAMNEQLLNKLPLRGDHRRAGGPPERTCRLRCRGVCRVLCLIVSSMDRVVA